MFITSPRNAVERTIKPPLTDVDMNRTRAAPTYEKINNILPQSLYPVILPIDS